ncbi:MAG: thioredoxin domain-containing protein [Verrucomicrobia bacterium]|nr:thioredoxin domain-containing protein [Verrucomicrobiota bacterium]
MVIAACWVATASAFAQASPSGLPERRPNRLIREKSPYLLQHAYNPVDWFPWGEEAFAKARRENKPIFLSIGYSTCHWCHVMERESFENAEVAQFMNGRFVSIKVDREERPDLDKVYMTFVQATTGGGGWPMTLLLTPDLKPFFGGTYFPPDDRWGRAGLKSLLAKISEAWKADRASIEAHASAAVVALQKYGKPEKSSGLPGPEIFDVTYHQIAAGFDSANGGFGRAPKFPRPVTLNFLFSAYARAPESDQGKRTLAMALLTLRKMADGGIHDQIGGGFHRYAVDGVWHVPHFEKMLYDQAQLATAYLAAFQITHETFFADSARDILDYVRRDMTDGNGGFHSAEDADSRIAAGKSERGEGAFYVWTRDEIVLLLGGDRARIFAFHYGVEADGNAATDPQGEFAGKNILFVRHTLAETARKFGLSEADTARALSECRPVLFAARSRRPRPNRDDKIITAWNGLMISAFARAAQVLDEPRYLEAARRAAEFLRGTSAGGSADRLHRSYREGVGAAEGFADDYAFLVQGLLDLYETSFEVRWLEWAQRLQATQDALFWDAADGGYFGTTGRDATVLFRDKEDYDGAEPSPNSVAAQNLLRFAFLLDQAPARKKAGQILAAFSIRLARAPSALPQMLVAADWWWGAPKQIVIAGRLNTADTHALLAELQRQFVPKKVVVLADGGEGQQFFARQVPFFHDLPANDGRATAYVCENYVCQLPTTSTAKFAELLAAKKTTVDKPAR